jgi:hypothetical protein
MLIMIYVLALSTTFRSSTYFLKPTLLAIHTFSVAGKNERTVRYEIALRSSPPRLCTLCAVGETFYNNYGHRGERHVVLRTTRRSISAIISASLCWYCCWADAFDDGNLHLAVISNGGVCCNM